MKAIDPEIARQLATELPQDAFVGVIRTFEADLARLVQQMIHALEAGAMEEYRRGAHGLAGAAGAIGARRLEQLARQAMSPAAMPEQDSIGTLRDEAKEVLSDLSLLASAPPAG